MKLKLGISLTFERARGETEDPGPQPEGGFSQAEVAGFDPDTARMPTGFNPPEGRA